MKIFCSYAFTGEDFEILSRRLSDLRDLFNKAGVEYYINRFAPGWQDMMNRGATGGEFLHLALKDLRTSDRMLAIQASSRRSEGMLMEVGAGVALGVPIILAQHQSSIGSTYLSTVADDTFVWRTESELLDGVYRIITE